ncbi:hypothetical protein KIN20_026102, partial [Parelaphostrongylus tenuis]
MRDSGFSSLILWCGWDGREDVKGERRVPEAELNGQGGRKVGSRVREEINESEDVGEGGE